MNQATRDLVLRYFTEELGMVGGSAPVLVDVLEQQVPDARVYGGDANFTGEPRTVLDVSSIAVQNFKGVASGTLELKPGVTGLFGANDQGKTTYLEALGYALAGDVGLPGGCGVDLLKAGTKELVAEVQFHGGFVARRVTKRVIARGKKAGETEVEVSASCSIEGEKADKPKAVEGMVQSYLGVDWGFVQRTCLVSQGKLAAVLDQQPAVRREVFYSMLSLDVCEDTRAKLSSLVKFHQEQVGTAAARREGAQRLVDNLKTSRAAINLTGVREELFALQAQRAAGSDSAGHRKILFDKGQVLTQRQAQLIRQGEHRARVLQSLHEEKALPCHAHPFTDTEMDAQFGAPVKRALAAMDALNGKLARLVADRDLVRERGKRLASMPPRCQLCAEMGKDCEITDAQKEAYRQQLLTQFRELDAQVKGVEDGLLTLEKERAAHSDRLHQVVAEETTRRRSADRIALLEQSVPPAVTEAELATIRDELATIGAQLEQLAQVGPGVDLTREIQTRLDRVAQAEHLDAKIAAASKDLGDVGAFNVEASKQTAAQLAVLMEAFAKPGIPLWLARQHLDAINTIAAELCAGDRFTFRFGPELEVCIGEVGSGHVGAIHPKLASGSARERAGLVLLAALSLYQQKMSGLTIPLLWIDEVRFQDDLNTEHVVDIVKRLGQRFGKVVFAASQWTPFLGAFDHEVLLGGGPAAPAAGTLKAAVASQEQAGNTTLPGVVPEPTVKLRNPPASSSPAALAEHTTKPAPKFTGANAEYLRLCAHHASLIGEHQRAIAAVPESSCERCTPAKTEPTKHVAPPQWAPGPTSAHGFSKMQPTNEATMDDQSFGPDTDDPF